MFANPAPWGGSTTPAFTTIGSTHRVSLTGPRRPARAGLRKQAQRSPFCRNDARLGLCGKSRSRRSPHAEPTAAALRRPRTCSLGAGSTIAVAELNAAVAEGRRSTLKKTRFHPFPRTRKPRRRRRRVNSIAKQRKCLESVGPLSCTSLGFPDGVKRTPSSPRRSPRPGLARRGRCFNARSNRQHHRLPRTQRTAPVRILCYSDLTRAPIPA